MKYAKPTLAIGAIGLFFSTASYANHYQREIDDIHLRTRQFVEYADAQWRQIEAFNNIWTVTEFELARLENSLLWNPPASSSDTSDSSALRDLTDEKVFVEVGLARLHEIRPRVDAKLKESADLAAQFPNLKPLHDKAAGIITQELNALEQTLNDRKKESDQSLELWKQWQWDAVQQRDADRAKTILSDLEVTDSLNQVYVIFKVMRVKFFGDLSLGLEDEARNLLTGHAWLKSVLPLFFADKLHTEFHKTYFANIMSFEEGKELKMATVLSTYTKPDFSKIDPSEIPPPQATI